jgi:hypothetical protein
VRVCSLFRVFQSLRQFRILLASGIQHRAGDVQAGICSSVRPSWTKNDTRSGCTSAR